MHRSADLVFSQQFDELVAIDLEPSQIQLNYKKMPRMLRILSAGWQLDFRQVSQAVLID